MFLFLDFDGVLRPVSAMPDSRWRAVDQFAALMQGRDVGVVVSSDYRSFMPFDSILQIFPFSLRQCIVGGAPVIANDWGDQRLPRRHREVLAWMEGNGHAHSRWIAVDDDADHFAAGCAQLVQIDGTRGLDASSVEQIEASLSRLY